MIKKNKKLLSFIPMPKGLDYGQLKVMLEGASGAEAARIGTLLGKLKHKQGDFKEALEWYSESSNTLEILCKHSGDKRLKFEYSCALSNVSAALGELGKPKEALVAAETALSLRKTLLGGSHFAIAESLTNTGRILFMLGRINRATEAFEEALTLFLTHSEGKEDTPYVAIAYLNVGLAYMEHPSSLQVQGRKAIEKATRLAVSIWGEEHPQTLIFKSSL